MPEIKAKILLVEDDAMIVEMYKIRFEEEGYQVLVSEIGSEAIKLAETEKPHVVLLDVILPEIDGFSILQNLKNNSETRDIPVLLLTNLAQEGDRQKGLDLGAVEYCVKSQLTPADVVQKIRNVLGGVTI